MIRFALFGAGRIGKLHAENLAASSRGSLERIFDISTTAAEEIAAKHGAALATGIPEALADGVDAVLIASPTVTHIDLILAAANAGKAIFCEKPIDLDIGRVDRCRDQLQKAGVPFQVGFNRRFDPTHRAVQTAVRAGEVGQVEQVLIVSRDPEPPSAEYVRSSGGLYRDMMIHDFDLARFLLDEEPLEVSASGSTMVDPEISRLGDVDTAMVTMRCESGALVHISNSRRAIYGYDQRVEVFGSRGMVQSGNRRESEVLRTTAEITSAREPLLEFFAERYAAAYAAEIEDFIDAIENCRTPSVTFEDGRRALILADAAAASLESGTVVRVEP